MTPKEKLAYIEAQICACENGEVNALVCPYCGELHEKAAPLCCETFAQACKGIIQLQLALNEPRRVQFRRRTSI